MKDVPRIDNRSEQIFELKQYLFDEVKKSWPINDVPKDVELKLVDLGNLLDMAGDRSNRFVQWYNIVHSNDPDS